MLDKSRYQNKELHKNHNAERQKTIQVNRKTKAMAQLNGKERIVQKCNINQYKMLEPLKGWP